MRPIIDLPQSLVQLLARICDRQQISRAEAIRRAVRDYAECFLRSEESHAAFGIWRERKIDGLEYQRNLRSEWD